jgi:hypothetical protein
MVLVLFLFPVNADQYSIPLLALRASGGIWSSFAGFADQQNLADFQFGA